VGHPEIPNANSDVKTRRRESPLIRHPLFLGWVMLKRFPNGSFKTVLMP